MTHVSHPERVVFPEAGKTKGDVVAYYERIAPRLLPHVLDRPMSMRRYPKGIGAVGFFQKNAPAHYPPSFGRFAVPRSAAASKKHPRRGADGPPDVTSYPVVREADHLPYLANQGAIELHVPTARTTAAFCPDRLVIDLDPPPNGLAKVRRAAEIVQERMEGLGLETVPVGTGSKGFHVVAAIRPSIEGEVLAAATQKLAALLSAEHPDDLTIVFRVAARGERVFVDWLRNNPGATVIAPYSLRARPRAPVAVPLTWGEIATTTPDEFTLDDVERLLARPDPLAAHAASPQDAGSFVARVSEEFERAGLVMETFDRFRS